ncbi:hypothetical protein ACHAXT_001666 [Thalassiosira profunda]
MGKPASVAASSSATGASPRRALQLQGFFLPFLLGLLVRNHVSHLGRRRIRPPRRGMGSTAASSARPSGSHVPARASSLADARSRGVSPLTTPIDSIQYTIRMNTWHRNEQLLISLDHHAGCEGAASIQVVWCDPANDPPPGVADHPSGKVVVERHARNSLNERFRILDESDTPTLGILSLDDDVLRPCEALDAAFVRWTRHPERIVGFNARSHRIDRKLRDAGSQEERRGAAWEYGMVGKSGLYSLTLPSKSCFLHRDYLDYYTAHLPREVYGHIDEHFECEDVAMSYFVSALTGGRPPLLADYWATESVLELYTRNGISWKDGHIDTRNICVNDFAEYLGLKEGKRTPHSAEIVPLKEGRLLSNEGGTFFGYGDEPESWSGVDPSSLLSPRLRGLVEELQRRESLSGPNVIKNYEWMTQLRDTMEGKAKKAGLVKGSTEWKMRWLYNCAMELNSDKRTRDCFVRSDSGPTAGNGSSSYFVCDVTEGVLHHVDGSDDWMMAGPPRGTGTHEGEVVCSVRVDPETCSVEVFDSRTG